MKGCYFIKTFGCQMNRLDSELVAQALEEAGYLPSADEGEADVILVNTCSVRKNAENRAVGNVGSLKHAKERNPGLVLGVIGCMAEREGQAFLDAWPHVDLVCGPGMFWRIPELVEQARAGERALATGHSGQALGGRLQPGRAHTAYVAAMRGCDNRCAYCVVPRLRGPVVSRTPGDIGQEVRMLADAGCREVTLLGQNVNAYGTDLRPRCDLAALLERLDPVPGIARVRFVTSHPRDVSDRLLRAMRDLPSACEYLHAPAQSGSDRMLAAMKRGYNATAYRAMIARARETVPGIGFVSDFIVGFPGESDADFEDTVALVRDVGYQNCFVFKYSERAGTAAAGLDDNVPDAAKRERNQRLLDVQREVSLARNRRLVGTVQEVMVEGPSKRNPSVLSARNRANRIVLFQGSGEPGDVAHVQIDDCTDLTLAGHLVEPQAGV